MTIFESIQENANIQLIKENLKKLFKDYDSAVLEYKHAIDNLLHEKLDTDKILKDFTEDNEAQAALTNIITKLNEIQLIFEQLGYEFNTGAPDDVDELNLIKQLDQMSYQMYKLIEDFERENFAAFVSGLNYLTSLVEIHYNNKFGELEETIHVTEEGEEVLDEAKDFLDEQPELKTNDIK